MISQVEADVARGYDNGEEILREVLARYDETEDPHRRLDGTNP
jgi:hypothetical protein